MQKVLALMVLILFAEAALAARLKGKVMNGERFKAQLTLAGGKAIRGKIRFRTGKKILFTAHDGTEVELRVRPLCAEGVGESMDPCWPKLMIDTADSRTGSLLILNK